MFSKTGNTVDSQVNQALHQGVGENPLAHQAVGQLPPNQAGYGQPGVGQPGMGIGQPGYGQPGMGIGQPGYGQPGMGIGQPGYGQPGFIQPGVTVDQSLGHSGLGTMQGMVGQGVSTGLGYHSTTVLPNRYNDPQVTDTGLGHRGMGTTHHTGTGAAVGTGVAAGAGAGALAHHEGKVGKKGMISFRPIEARFNHDKDLLGKMDPYCKFKIGIHRGKSAVAKGQGVSPVWNDVVTIKHKNQEFAKLKMKDHDKLRHDDTLGTAKIPLDQVLAAGSVDQWIPVEKHGKVTGEVHIIMEYVPRGAAI